MKKLLLSICIMISSISFAQNPYLKWGNSIGGASDDWGRGITIDGLGNVYTIGYFNGAIDFDPSASVAILSSNGLKDVFISKIDADGHLIWAKSIGSPNDDYGYSITVDDFGNVYATGSFISNIDLDPGVGTYSVTSNGMSDVFVLKLNSLGNFIWGKSFGGTGNESGASIAISNSGYVYTAGSFEATVDFDPNIGVTNISSSGGTDIFVSKIDVLGNFVWAKKMGGTLFDYGYSLALDRNENIYTSGYFTGTADLDPSPVVNSVLSNGSIDVFISKLDSAGNFIFGESFGGLGADVCNSIHIDKSGNSYLTGGFEYSVDFDPGVGVNTINSNGANDIFILKLDNAGNFRWVKTVGGTAGDYAYSLTNDTLKNVYLSGNYSGTVDFDSSTSTYSLSAVGSTDAFYLKLDSLGDFILARGFGSSGNEYGTAIATDNLGGVVFSGAFSGTVDFDPRVGIFNLTSNGNTDIFICKIPECYSPQNPINITSALSQTICVNNSTELLVTGTGTITWFPSLTSASAIGTGTSLNTPTLTAGNYTFYAEANTCTISATRTPIDVIVDNTCQDIWPGDANSDGIADNTDVLELGLHYTQTGTARTTINNAWQAFNSTNWIGIITNGKNLNHSDCNGDGTINNDDTLAIYNNYGLTHTFKLSQVQSTNPALNIVPDQTIVDKGKWGTASIYLGDATNVMNNVNGVAYTIAFDNAMIEQDSAYITYQNSFLDAGQNLHFRKTNFVTGALYTASTHTNNTNVNGYGKIATLHYKISPDLATDAPLNLAITQAVISSASGSITPITSGASSVIAIGASVGIKDYTTNSNFLLYPNPTSEILNLELEILNTNTQLFIYNALGALVLKENISSKRTSINTTSFAKGLYIVELQSNNQVLHRAKLVKE